MLDFDTNKICPLCHMSYCSAVNSVCPDCKKRIITERFEYHGRVEIISESDSCLIYSVGCGYILKVLYGSRYEEGKLEAKVLKQLQGCKNIIWLMSAEYDKNAVYILERSYLTLSKYIRLEQLTLKDVFGIAQDICNALIFCHEKGYYHLDVHPRNIYIDDNGRAQLGDFGNAQKKNEARASDLTRITRRYVFPEYFTKNNPVITEQWDLYGLCMVLYGLLNNGILPKECTPEDFVSGNYSIPAPLEDELSKLVTSCIMNQGCKTLYEFRQELEKIDLSVGIQYDRTLHFPDTYKEKTGYKNCNDLNTTPDEDHIHLEESGCINESCGNIIDELPDNYAEVIFDADGVADTVALGVWYKPLDDYTKEIFDADSVAFTMALEDIADEVPCAWGEEVFDAEGIAFSAALDDTEPDSIFDTDTNTDTAPPAVSDVQEPTEEKSISISEVCFSAVYNKEAERDTCISIDVIMYEPDFRSAVELVLNNLDNGQEKQSGVFRTAIGTVVTVELTSPDIKIDDCIIDMPWYGKYLDFSFLIDVPADYARKQIRFTASIFFGGIPATRLKFVVNCQKAKDENIQLLREDIKSAFVSYASKDRQRVAGLIQGMQAVRRDLNLFFDVENLRTGEQWEKRIYSEIDKKDYLFLCWSNNAAKSNWVDTEWRYALKTKGENGIMPMPLELPELCPPPDELKALSFNNRLLYLINSYTDTD